MPDLLPPRELAALRAAAEAGGLYRGKSGFYAGLETRGRVHLPATVRGLQKRGLLCQPDLMSPRRVITERGRALLEHSPAAPAPVVARPRAYVD